ncbi:MAG: toll/interleukin-1 receptor domain-containing protein [Acidobacteria bacterium]|nr:toll/interleukin-1 receptor domain-containing protein [Acidobacteriota bacterium]
MSLLLNEASTMQNSGRTHVFVNYATEDGVFVDWLCLRLLREGYQVWCDRLKLLGGESYPRDIDEAISNRTFRFLAVLSRNSIHKSNPLKERTLALQLARERKENFVIPLNLDGLAPSELGWMQADLTFIPFTNWHHGLSQLLKNLDACSTPKMDCGATSVAALVNHNPCLTEGQERLWTNLLPIRRIPATIYRFEHDLAMPEEECRKTVQFWPHYRENPTVCWSFEAPPVELSSKYRFSLRGSCEGWRTASGPDINFFNLGKKVINSALRFKLISSGLHWDRDSGALFFPNKPEHSRFSFRTYCGSSWVRAVGTRSFKTLKGPVQVRYHLSPVLTTWLDYGGRDFVQIKIRLHITDLSGKPINPATMQSRRKAICRSWWNHQWVSRIMATLELLGGEADHIAIGSLSDQQIILDRFPISLGISTRLDESVLKPETEVRDDIALMDREKDDEEEPSTEG